MIVSSPSAVRSRSRSRATLSVDRLARKAGVRCTAQPSASDLASASRVGSGAPPGTAGSAAVLAAAVARSASVRQRTADEAPTPRGSIATTSKRASTSGPNVPGDPGVAGIARSVSVAATPGPPGLKNRVPIRRRGSVARCRITARATRGPSGSVYSWGTSRVPHSRPGPHALQVTGSGGGTAGVGGTAGAAAAQPVRDRATTAARTASGRRRRCRACMRWSLGRPSGRPDPSGGEFCPAGVRPKDERVRVVGRRRPRRYGP